MIDRLRGWVPPGAAGAEISHSATRDYLDLGTTGEGALPIRVAWTGDTISVSLSEWTQTWDREDEDVVDEVADLVAAARTGLARVRVFRAGDRPYRWDVEFRIGGTSEPHDTLQRGRGPWLKKPTVEILSDDAEPPEGFELSEPGTLPRAPWVGVLQPAGEPEATVVEPDGELDLHTYKPKQVKPAVQAYIEECQRRGITQLRIVHGKGIGNLRRTVHAFLDKHPAVKSFRLGGAGEGSWGATVVDLHPGQEP